MYSGATLSITNSGQFYSLQYESLTYLGGWQGVVRWMSYRNHYMCSGEATSIYLKQQDVIECVYLFPNSAEIADPNELKF